MTEEMFREDRVDLLRRWAGDRCADLRKSVAAAGGKHPTLCLMGSDLLDAWSDPLFIIVDRPIEESIQSLFRASWGWTEQAARYALPYMFDAREAFLRKHAPRHLRVSFHRLLQQPGDVIDECVGFIGHSPTEEQRRAAIDAVAKRATVADSQTQCP